MKNGNKGLRIALYIGCGVLATAIALGIWAYMACGVKYGGKETRIFIPADATEQSVADTLRKCLGEEFGSQVAQLWRARGANPERAHGSYVATKGITALDMAKKLITGSQDPVRVTFNNVRTLEQLSEKIAARMELSDSAFLLACDSVLPLRGYDKPNFPAAFFPDTYEFYWNTDASTVVNRLVDHHDQWWSENRRAKAAELGLSPNEVATLASIVEEETAKADEKPKVARLYLNRLSRGMMLQADPTVKFAVGDFTLRRITGEHLSVDSPYNTYHHEGLPPGPIRIVEAATIEAVLDAPPHDYIFMCAKEDFSGYHNFAVSAQEHAVNARRYHQELNRRNIK